MATVAGGHKGVKRTISSECREFNSDWTERYFFTLSRCKTKPLCLICNESMAAMKEYNVRRHYETKHGEAYAQFTGKARSDKIADLQRQLKSQQNIFWKANNESICAVKASYVVAELIAKAKKPFSDGEFLKECMLKVADVLCPDKKKKIFSNVSLSRNTIADRITEMAQDISGQLPAKSRQFIAYSLAVDESTDLSDTSQLSVFIRGVDCDLNVVEEFVSLLPMSGTTKGVDLYSKVETLINDMQLPWENLRGLTTDGAPAMTSENTGLVGLVKKRLAEMGCSGTFISSHCIIHQEALCARVVTIPHVMNIVVKTVNYIRAHALNHRQFKTFLDDLDAEHGDVLFYTEVRWLSRGTVLKRFFDLRTEIAMFLVHKDNVISELEDPSWLADLAFLVAITSELNALNVKLQGRDQLVNEMYDHVRTFERKLLLWEKQLQDNNFVHFPTCTIIARTYVQLKANNDLYVSKIGELRQEFGKRFANFRACEAQFRLFCHPFSADVESVPTDLQMELIEMQCSQMLALKFKEVGYKQFYQYLDAASFGKLRVFAANIMALFGSSYVCEQTFSAMKLVKSKCRTRLTDEHLNAVLIMSSTQKLMPNIDELTDKKQCQRSHARE